MDFGGGGGGGGDTTTTIRYAPYIETYHEDFLAVNATSGTAARADNPYTNHFVPYTIESHPDAFFGVGYTIASFPSLYDMYGKFMAGLDVELLWEQVLEGTQDNASISGLSYAHSQILNEDVEVNILPRFQIGLRDANAVMSSSYVIGKALIENERQRKLAEFTATLQYKLVPIAAERWYRHLEWNRGVITTYQSMINAWYNTELAVDSYNLDNFVKETLWPFTVLDYERANIAAMQGARSSTAPAGSEPSTFQRAIGGGMGGAAMGGAVAGPTGAVIGGVLGLASAFF